MHGEYQACMGRTKHAWEYQACMGSTKHAWGSTKHAWGSTKDAWVRWFIVLRDACLAIASPVRVCACAAVHGAGLSGQDGDDRRGSPDQAPQVTLCRSPSWGWSGAAPLQHCSTRSHRGLVVAAVCVTPERKPYDGRAGNSRYPESRPRSEPGIAPPSAPCLAHH